MVELWLILFSWLPAPLAIAAGALLLVAVAGLACRVLKFIWDALPFL